MLTKDKRRAERRWRSHCVWMRRLKNDWQTHGWNWNWMSARGTKYTRFGLTEEAKCSIWAETTLCDCFWNPGFNGMARFKDTPTAGRRKELHFELGPKGDPRGGVTIQEVRSEEVVRENWSTRKADHNKWVLVKQTCLCGYLMKTFWKKAKEVLWSDRRSADYCPGCEKRFGPRNGRIRMPA